MNMLKNLLAWLNNHALTIMMIVFSVLGVALIVTSFIEVNTAFNNFWLALQKAWNNM